MNAAIQTIPIVAAMVLNLSAVVKVRRHLHIMAIIGCALLAIFGIITNNPGLIIGQTISVGFQGYALRKYWN